MAKTGRLNILLYGGDGRIIREVMYLSAGETPTARFPAIFEHVWILEKILSADEKFIVFGDDVLVPRLWLEKYGKLVKGVKFYYVSGDGGLGVLQA